MVIPIFLDTNALMHSIELGINIKEHINRLVDRSYVILVHPMVLAEIMDLMLEDGKTGRQAKLAMQLSSLFRSYEDDRTYDGTDVCLLYSAMREEGVVFTYDKELRDRCVKHNVPVISLFKKGNMKLFGHIP